MRRNPLFSRGIDRLHMLTTYGNGKFEYVTGRRPGPEDYSGVHTTSIYAVACAYAISAWEKKSDIYDCPAVVYLNTDGLTPLPDIDGMMHGGAIYSEIRKYVKEMLEEGKSEKEIISYFNDYTVETEIPEPLGKHPSEVVFDMVLSSTPNPIEAIISNSEYDPMDTIERFGYLGEVPEGALMEIVGQRRFDFDFEEDRVVRIDRVRPWWPQVMDEQDCKVIDIIEKSGWSVVTAYDVFNNNIMPKYKILYGDKDGSRDMHGTTMRALRSAFPSLARVMRCVYEVEPVDVVLSKIRNAVDDEYEC